MLQLESGWSSNGECPDERNVTEASAPNAFPLRLQTGYLNLIDARSVRPFASMTVNLAKPDVSGCHVTSRE
ncbi:hypothetical protein HYPDE_22743 [Hyphomicrobium denitrificans 1NES1]|uniref:Uncharacterized protein n=1 Tax=Hyphomicrobium denitrificans 1NES1 TaxID=670307 RepID=N0B847_9HYPH|nr:hypothetical protein HYPDE_22743 [Hyphomicrobium denitrificans 1NES1]